MMFVQLNNLWHGFEHNEAPLEIIIYSKMSCGLNTTICPGVSRMTGEASQSLHHFREALPERVNIDRDKGTTMTKSKLSQFG